MVRFLSSIVPGSHHEEQSLDALVAGVTFFVLHDCRSYFLSRRGETFLRNNIFGYCTRSASVGLTSSARRSGSILYLGIFLLFILLVVL